MGYSTIGQSPFYIKTCSWLLLLLLVCVNEIKSSWYKGCFQMDMDSNDDPDRANGFPGSLTYCSKHCKNIGVDLFGIQNSSCVCLQSLDEIIPMTPLSCDKRCSDTPDQTLPCGGLNSWSVYNTTGPYVVQVLARTESRWLEAGIPVKVEVAAVLDTFVDMGKELSLATEWKNVLELECRGGMAAVEASTIFALNGSQEYSVCILTFPHAGDFVIEVTVQSLMSTETIKVPVRILSPEPRLLQVSPLNSDWTLPSCISSLNEDLDKIIQNSWPHLDSVPGLGERLSPWKKNRHYRNGDVSPEGESMGSSSDTNSHILSLATQGRGTDDNLTPVIALFVNQTLKLEASVATGVNLTFELLIWNGVSWDVYLQRPHEDNCFPHAECKQIEQHHVISQTGIFPGIVLVHNHLGLVLNNITVVGLDLDIRDMSIQAVNLPPNGVLIGEVIVFHLTSITTLRQSTYIQVDFGDGLVKTAAVRERQNTTRFSRNPPTLFASYGEGCKLSLKFDQVYNKKGVYRPLVKLYNTYTSTEAYSESEIVVWNKIVGLKIVSDEIIAKGEDATFRLESYMHSTNLTARWSATDENGTLVYNKTLKSFGEMDLALLEFTMTFSEMGRYKIDCEVSNPLMKQDVTTYVLVQEIVDGLSIICDHGHFLEVEYEIECKAQVTAGTVPIHYIWEIHEQSEVSEKHVERYSCTDTALGPCRNVNSEDDGSSSVIRYTLDRPGTFNVSVKAENLFGHTRFSLPHLLQVQLPVGCLLVKSWSPAMPKTNVNVIATASRGTALSFDIDINGTGRMKIDQNHREVIGEVTIFSFPLIFPYENVYNVYVYAYNGISSTFVSHEIHIQEKVTPFSVRVMRQPLHSFRTLLVENLAGELLLSSNLLYKFSFPDGSSHITQVPVLALGTRIWLNMSTLNVYKTKGLYSVPVKVQVFNDASDETNAINVEFKEKELRFERKYRSVRDRRKRRGGKRRSKQPALWHQTYVQNGEKTYFLLETKSNSTTSILVDYGDGSRDEVSCQGQSCNWDRTFQLSGVFRLLISFLGEDTSSSTSSHSSFTSPPTRWRPGLVQSMIVVEQPIRGLRVEGPRHVGIDCNHEWKAVLESGTHVVYVWTLDKVVENPTTIGKYSAEFTTSRIHILTLRVSNDINEAHTQIQIWVRHPIKAVKLTMSYSLSGLPTNISLQIYAWSPHFSISCVFGDGNNKTIHSNDKSLNNSDKEFGKSVIISEIYTKNGEDESWPEFPNLQEELRLFRVNLQHVYLEPGDYDVNILVENGISTFGRSRRHTVAEGIGSISLRASHDHVMSVNEELMVTAEVSSGRGLVFHWDFSDRRPTRVNSEGKTSTAKHAFEMPNVYEVKVIVTSPNQPEGITKRLPNLISVLKPVKMASIVQGLKGAAVLSEVKFEARSDGSSVSFTFHFGDGSNATVKGDESRPWATGSVTHVYKEVGSYSVLVTAFNDLSRVTAAMTDPFLVQAPIKDLKLLVPLCMRFGGKAALKATVTSGTNVSYHWKLYDETEIIGGSEVEHQYRSIGKKIVQVTAMNLVSEETRYGKINIVEDFTGVDLVAEKHVVVGGDYNTYTATVHPPSASVGAWYVWVLDPTQEPKKRAESKLLHEHIITGSHLVKVTAHNCLGTRESDVVQVKVVELLTELMILFIGDTIVNKPVMLQAQKYTGNSLTMTWDFGDGSRPTIVNNSVSDKEGDENNTVLHVYTSIGEYVVTLKAENSLSGDEVSRSIFILEQPCNAPEVVIEGSRNADELHFYKSETIELEAWISVKCSITSQVQFQWKIFEGETDKEVIVQVPRTWARENEMRHPNILLPPGSLEAGLYTFIVRVDMNGTIIPVYANSTTKVRVSRSPLYVMVKGGVYKTIGRDGTIVMDASWSRDVDNPYAELGYEWQCTPLDANGINDTECFHSIESIPLRNQSIWTFPASLLRQDRAEFVFNISVWRLSDFRHQETLKQEAGEVGGPLRVSADQVIRIDSKQENLVPLSVECVQCWRNQVNLHNKVSFRAQCKGCEERDVTYHWELSTLQYEDMWFDGSPLLCVSPDGSGVMRMVIAPVGNDTETILVPYNASNQTVNSTTDSETSEPAVKTTEATIHHNVIDNRKDKGFRKGPGLEGGGKDPKEGAGPFRHTAQVEARGSRRLNPMAFLAVGEGGAAGTGRKTGRTYVDPIEQPGGRRNIGNDGMKKTTTTTYSPRAHCDTDRDCFKKESSPSPPPPHLVSMDTSPVGLTSGQTLTGLSSPSLVIKPGVLRQGKAYLVKVTATAKDGTSSEARTFFEVNQSPRKGRCTLKPREGVSMDTAFNLYCYEWYDVHTPFRFEVSYQVKGSQPEDSPRIIYRGLRHKTNFQLPAGLRSHDYKVIVSVTVLDRFLARTPICQDSIVVRPPGHADEGPRGSLDPGAVGASERRRGRHGGRRRERLDRDWLIKRRVEDHMLEREANDTRSMARQQIYNGIAPDFVAFVRQLTARLNDDDQNDHILRSIDPSHRQAFYGNRANIRSIVVDTLKMLPLRSPLELARVLRCLTDVLHVTHELNGVTILNAVDLLSDIVSQTAVYLNYSSQGMNYDLDPVFLTLTVRTASNVMTALAESDTLFWETEDREGFYAKMSKAVIESVQSIIALQLQVQSVGETPVQAKSPFMSVYAYLLQPGHHTPVTLQDVRFQLPNISTSLLQQWSSLPPISNPVENKIKQAITPLLKIHNNSDTIYHNSNSTSDRRSEPENKESNNNKINNPNHPSARNSEISDSGMGVGDSKNAMDENKMSIVAATSTRRGLRNKGMKKLVLERQMRLGRLARGHRFAMNDNCFQSRAMTFQSDPNNLMEDQAGKFQTAVASLDLYSCDGSKLFDVKGLPQTDLVRIDIQRQQSNDSESVYPHCLKKTEMNVHELMPGGESGPLLSPNTHPEIDKLLYIHIQLDNIRPGHRAFPLLVLISDRSVPHNSRSFIFKQVYNTSRRDIKVILPASSFQEGKSYNVGLSEATFNSGRRRNSEVEGLRYNLSAWWDTCVYWDEKERSWRTDGCQVLESSSLQALHCSCSHLTQFGGFFDLIPTEVTVFSVDEFSSAHESILVVIVVGSVLLLYLFTVLVIRPSIRNGDDSQRGRRLVFLQDHCPSHIHKYEVIIETGFHHDSGTTSKISLILHGDEGVSETRELTSAENVSLFERNSRNHFIITLPESPGRIFKIQLWHNNSGSSPGWFIRQAVVRDVNTGQSFHFLCQRWLAVDRDDGKVEREFSILDGSAMTFLQVFVCKGSQYLSDLHTWLSVFTCPPNSHFTRSQRLFLCLAILMSYMGLATVWFHLMPPAIRGEFGLLDLSWSNIVTGSVICCMMFPVKIAIAFLFRRSCVNATKSSDGSRGKSGLDLVSQGDDDNNMGPVGSVPYSILDQSILNWQHIQEWAHRQWQKRQVHIISSTDAVKDAQNGQQQNSPSLIPLVQQTMLADEDDTELGSSGFEDATSQATAERNRIIATSDTSSLGKKSDSEHSSSDTVISNRKLLLPSWFRYIAWALCFLLTASGAAVTVWYGFRFSHRRSVMWIQTVYFSLITSIFIVQPLMILFETLYITLRHGRNPAVLDMDRDVVDRFDLEWEERRYHEMTSWQEEDEMQKGLAARSRSRYLRFAGPIQEKQLKSPRRKLLKEKRALTLFRHGCFLVALTVLLAVVIFGRNRGYQAQLKHSAQQMFAGSMEDKSSFMNIKSVPEWYTWSKNELVPALSSLETLTDGRKRYTSSELGVIVGNVQLRQFKVTPQPCASQRPLGIFNGSCFPDYSPGSEAESFDGFGVWGYLSWYGQDRDVIPVSNDRGESLKQIEALERSQWLDIRTRAVMVEVTIHNPPSRLYSSVTLLMEVSASGKVIPSAHIRASQLFHYVTLWEHCLLACEMLLVVIIITMLSHMAKKLFYQRLAYFMQFWNCVEMAMSLLSLLYMVLYICRFIMVTETVESLRSQFYETFVSFVFLTLWDEMIHTVLGLMLFCVLLQWIRVCSYNPTIARLVGAYKKSRREIALAVGLFAGQLMALSSLGHLLFGAMYYPMHSFMTTAMTVTGLSVRILSPLDPANRPESYMLSVFLLFAFVFLHGVVGVYIFSVLTYKLKGSKIRKRFSMPPRKLLQFYWHYFWERTSPREHQLSQESETTLSPEFIMAEILYLVDELLFRMNNLLGTSGLPEKQHSFSDSDSTPDMEDDGISTGGSDDLHNFQTHLIDENCDTLDTHRLEDRVHRIEDKLCSNEPYLAQLLKLDSFGANILSDEEEQELRSQLEYEIFQQLQKQRQETNDIDHAAFCLSAKPKLESPKIMPCLLNSEPKDSPPPTLIYKTPNSKACTKQMSATDSNHVKLHSPKRPIDMKSPVFFPDGEMKPLMKMTSTAPVMNSKSLKRSQSLKVPVRDTAGIFDTTPLGLKKNRQGCIVEKDVDHASMQAKMLVNRHSSVKGKREMMAFDRFSKKDTNSRSVASSSAATSILRKTTAAPRQGELSGDSEKDQPLSSLSHIMSSGNVSPQSSSEGERSHKRTDSSSGQSGADSRLDTPKMIGKRLDLPPRPTFSHNGTNLSPHKVRPLDLVGGEWAAAESSSGSEQEVVLGGHKRMSSIGRRNLRKTKSRGKGKGDDVDINSAIVLSEDFHPAGRHGGFSDCSIIIHPVPANVDLDEISIPEEL